MKRLAFVLVAIGGFASNALAQEKEACSVEGMTCRFPDGGPGVMVTAKVFPEGLGVEVFVLNGKWKTDTALSVAEEYAQEVMALKGWCVKGYSNLGTTGNDDVGRRVKLLCKQ